MDNAKLVEYNLDITLGCPKCDYLFQLSNYSIPTEGSTYQVCENCQIPLEVKPISIDIDFKKPVKIKVDGFAAVSGNPTQNVEQKDNKNSQRRTASRFSNCSARTRAYLRGISPLIRCACNVRAVRVRCACGARAVRMRCACVRLHAVRLHKHAVRRLPRRHSSQARERAGRSMGVGGWRGGLQAAPSHGSP